MPTVLQFCFALPSCPGELTGSHSTIDMSSDFRGRRELNRHCVWISEWGL